MRLADGAADRLGQVSVKGEGDQMGQNLGVRVGSEDNSAGFEPGPEGPEVLHYPVVHDHEIAGRVAVGMGVPVRRNPVGCPPGVAYAGVAGKGSPIHTSDEPGELPLRLGDGHLPPAGDR